MNKKQKVLIVIFSVIVTAMIIYPPFQVNYNNKIIQSGYSFIWKPIIANEYVLGEIDINRLFVQILGLILVFGAILFLFTDPTKKNHN